MRDPFRFRNSVLTYILGSFSRLWKPRSNPGSRRLGDPPHALMILSQRALGRLQPEPEVLVVLIESGVHVFDHFEPFLELLDHTPSLLLRHQAVFELFHLT
eukprot:TRINITY_DN19056_c0_g4_i1.p1 TRINITY_DN19056_c0_g4~~TRINITY_DN19056_c0_g4_i1.p1  ORF type:complete len:101 (+),score=3.09 TRINITY_DN19056_c0_g4_i1:286-588(+)